MQRLARYLPSNSSLWLMASALWVTAALIHGATAVVSTRPTVFLGLSSVTLTLAWLSWFVSRSYRDLERMVESARLRQRPRSSDSAVESLQRPLEFRADTAQTPVDSQSPERPNSRHESARTV